MLAFSPLFHFVAYYIFQKLAEPVALAKSESKSTQNNVTKSRICLFAFAWLEQKVPLLLLQLNSIL